MTENLENMVLRKEGDATAVAKGLAAVASSYGDVGLSDDFLTIWREAAATTLHFDDLDALDVLVRRVDEDPSEPPRGLRGHRALYAALRDERAGADGAHVVAGLRLAVAEYDAWRSPVFAALGRRELGLHLQRQGRLEEAEVELDLTRATFTRLGAAAWLRDLDRARADVHS